MDCVKYSNSLAWNTEKTVCLSSEKKRFISDKNRQTLNFSGNIRSNHKIMTGIYKLKIEEKRK